MLHESKRQGYEGFDEGEEPDKELYFKCLTIQGMVSDGTVKLVDIPEVFEISMNDYLRFLAGLLPFQQRPDIF